jgi:hypothetical protein
MAKQVQFDELRLVLLVPADLEEAACEAIRRTLESKPFRDLLRRAIRQVFQRYPELAPVRVRISG